MSPRSRRLRQRRLHASDTRNPDVYNNMSKTRLRGLFRAKSSDARPVRLIPLRQAVPGTGQVEVGRYVLSQVSGSGRESHQTAHGCQRPPDRYGSQALGQVGCECVQFDCNGSKRLSAEAEKLASLMVFSDNPVLGLTICAMFRIDSALPFPCRHCVVALVAGERGFEDRVAWNRSDTQVGQFRQAAHLAVDYVNA